MKLYGVTAEQLQQIMAKVSRSQYRNNLEFVYLEQHRNHVQFTLRVHESSGKGARLSQSLTSRGNRRHLVSACWHAHRDLMQEIFKQFPEAKLTSAQATYKGKTGFEQGFLRTGERNIGSMMEPLLYEDACEYRDSAA